MSKILKWVPGFILGILVSAIASFAHADRIRIGDRPIYFGLVLAPLFLLVTQRWIMQYSANRISGISFALAWVLVTILMAVPNSDGDLALGATWYSTVYLGTAALLLSMSSVISPRAKGAAVLEN